MVNRTNQGFLVENHFYDALYRPKTIQSLFSLFIIITNVAYWYHQSTEEKLLANPSLAMHPASSDLKKGLLFVTIFLLGYCMIQIRDGVLIRPHPVVWRFVHGCGLIYVLVLLFMLPFQPEEMRLSLHTLISPSMGNHSLNTDYGTDCRFTWDNFSLQFFEFFTLAHAIGYTLKALVYRDWVLLLAHSVLFELIEVSCAYLLPNFNECWWDHLLLDVFGANLLGSLVGMWLVKYLEKRNGKGTRKGKGKGKGELTASQINWSKMSSLKHISSARLKARRILLQFTPLSWDLNKWSLTQNPTHFVAALITVISGLAVETSMFFLKYFLWIDMSNRYLFVIMSTKAALSAHAYREWYVYMAEDETEETEEKEGGGGGGGGGGGSNGRNTKQQRGEAIQRRLGHNAWLMVAIIVSELAVCIKWSIDPGFSRPYPPRKVSISWLLFFIFSLLWYNRRYRKQSNDLFQTVLGGCALLPLGLLFLGDIHRTMFYSDQPAVPVGRNSW